MKEVYKNVEKYFYNYNTNKNTKTENYIVERTIKEYENDFYKTEIIKRRYFKKEKNYIIYHSLGLWENRYCDLVKDIIHFATLIAVKENLINI